MNRYKKIYAYFHINKAEIALIFINEKDRTNCMKYIHNITIRAFSKNDTPESIEKGFDFIVPFDMMKEKIKINTEYFGADSDNPDAEPLTVYSISFDRQSFIGEFMRYFRGLLSPGQKKIIIEKAEKYMDEDCAVYIRLDKDALIRERI